MANLMETLLGETLNRYRALRGEYRRENFACDQGMIQANLNSLKIKREAFASLLC